jgi:hypothetical protein
VTELSRVIRPAAVVPEVSATKILRELTDRDVSAGGVWNARQRYDRPWDGEGLASRGTAELIGTVAVAYGTPVRDHITIYRVTVTDHGNAAGWSVERLCDEALSYGGLSLADCPRAEMAMPPVADPFHTRR